jgi:hypothetical protein
MKVPKYIKRKMHSAANHFSIGGLLMREVDQWFDKQGFDVDQLRSGDGVSLEEIEYGNDITDAFCERLENENTNW